MISAFPIKDCGYQPASQCRAKGEKINRDDLCASFRKLYAVFLVKKLMSAAEALGYDKIAIAGGVSANSDYAGSC